MTPFRMIWAPPGAVLPASTDWPRREQRDFIMRSATDRCLICADQIAYDRARNTIRASWHDPAWDAMGNGADEIVAIVKPDSLTIEAPVVWRGQVYFRWDAGCLWSSSDIRSLCHTGSTTELSFPGIAAFLTHGLRAGPPGDPTLYDGVLRVPPGFCAVIHMDRRTTWERTWRPERSTEFNSRSLTEATANLRGSIENACARILQRHERVACLISGGLDSTLVAGALLDQAPERVLLFNVGSGLGTPAEHALRAQFLASRNASIRTVELSPDANLLSSLRATNAVAGLPSGCLFTHIFEQIIDGAQSHGCDAIVTGDGGDEIFLEREEFLVDLLSQQSSLIPSTASYFALRNKERAASTVRRAVRRRQFLDGRSEYAEFMDDGAPPEQQYGEELNSRTRIARRVLAEYAVHLWREGWTYSGIGSYRRTMAIPEWEPLSSAHPGFPVYSPLGEQQVLHDALCARRDEMMPLGCGARPKWLLRRASLQWLPRAVALHPKIGNADGIVVRQIRERQFDDLMGLLTSETAKRIGIDIPLADCMQNSPLWRGDQWLRAAALVAWCDRAFVAQSHSTAGPTVRISKPMVSSALPEAASPSDRGPTWKVALLAPLNVLAQLTARPRWFAVTNADATRLAAGQTEKSDILVDLARRACRFPLVTGEPLAMSRAIAWLLTLSGSKATIVRGVAEGEIQSRYWVVTDGFLVDVTAAEAPLVAESRTT